MYKNNTSLLTCREMRKILSNIEANPINQKNEDASDKYNSDAVYLRQVKQSKEYQHQQGVPNRGSHGNGYV